MEVNKIYNMDCMELINSGQLDKKIDLVVTDAPYEFINKNPVGGGFMNKENKKHLHKVNDSFGMSFEPTELLESCKKVCKKFNGYFFTNKSLLTKYIGFAEKNKYKFDVLLWLKNNPVPVFKGHYLIDKEYIVYIRESGATFNSNLNYENYFTYQTFPIGKKEKGTQSKVVGLDVIEITLLDNNKEIWKRELHENDISRKSDISDSILIEDKYLNIFLYGSSIFEKYLNECKYTTKMGISKTTISQISNYLHRLNTKEYTLDAKKLDELYISHVENVENSNLFQIIIKRKSDDQHLIVNNAGLKLQLRIKEKEKLVSHPSPKPQHLLNRFIKISSNEGDLIFDPYMGSGTTAAACKELGRNYIGCEINPEYCKICDERLGIKTESELKEVSLFDYLSDNI